MNPLQTRISVFNSNFTSIFAFLEIQYLRPIQAFVYRVVNSQTTKFVYSVNLQPSKNAASTFDAMIIGNNTTNDYNVNTTMV